MSIPGPIYEVTLSVDPEIAAAFDIWLEQHIEQMLELEGFSEAELYSLDEDDDGHLRRVVHYHVDSDADLERYLAGPAEYMRQSSVDEFGDHMQAVRRILHQSEFEGGRISPTAACLNCGTILGGQYCGNCGQRARNRLISILELTRDAFGDMFELDSRLWRTLLPLLAKPGQLTRDYLEGRRARYMPPFRTYLVLSLLFFFATFFKPQEDFSFLFEPEPDSARPPAAEATTDGESAADDVQREVLKELADEGILTEEVAEAVSNGEEDGDATKSSIDDCKFSTEELDFPPWLARRLTTERLQAVCEAVKSDDGSTFVENLIDNVPAGLIFLLPVMALVLKILYPLSKRYYVEHLLFVVHYHAFIFLILTLQVTFSNLADGTGLTRTAPGITGIAAGIYIPVYLYKSMRRVYTQGHILTAGKYIVLTLAYFVGLTTILLFAALFAAFSTAR